MARADVDAAFRAWAAKWSSRETERFKGELRAEGLSEASIDARVRSVMGEQPKEVAHG
jgi:hypothetical protein